MLDLKTLVMLSGGLIFGSIYFVFVFKIFLHRLPKNTTKAFICTLWAIALTSLAMGAIINAGLETATRFEKLSKK